MKVYWYEQNLSDVPAEEVWLSIAERNHLRSLRFAKRRADWLLGRWTAKNAVAMFLSLTASSSRLTDIEIWPTMSGAPRVLFRGGPVPISISLSHRESVALCALGAACALLGCDLEAVEPHSEAFVADYFSAEEQALVQEAQPADREWILSLLWSGKESALKVFGEGLRLDTRQVIVSVRSMLELQNERADNPSPCSSFCVRKFSRGNGWRPLEVRKTSGQILQGWWSQTAKLMRTVLAVPPPDPPIRMKK
jgi:4'-phosphopantetheinyl transferase